MASRDDRNSKAWLNKFMQRNNISQFLWLALFIVSMLLAPTYGVHLFNERVSHDLEWWGHRYPALQLIWVVGGLPLTTLLVIYRASGYFGREPARWRILGIFILGGIMELVVKHFVATPFPPNVPPPTGYRQLILWTNIEPSTVFAWLRQLNPSTAGVHHLSSHLLRGSFPSGHVFRITYAYGLFLSSKWRLVIAGVAAFCVVATGGHWMWDALGGFLLASWGLEWRSTQPKGRVMVNG